jgi:hypothetical protein
MTLSFNHAAHLILPKGIWTSLKFNVNALYYAVITGSQRQYPIVNTTFSLRPDILLFCY